MTASCYSTTATPFHGEVALPYWQTLVRVAEQSGINRDLIDQLLNADQAKGDLRSISVNQYLALMRYGIEHCSDFGLRVGQSVTLGSYPVLGMTLLSCNSLRQVLEQIVRYESLNHDLGVSKLTFGSVESRFTWTPNAFHLTDQKDSLSFHLVMSVFAGIKIFSPWLINRVIPVEHVSFMAAAPKNIALYKDFFNAELQFNQPENSITVKSDVLTWPVLNGDSASFNALTSHAENLLLTRDDQQDIIWQLKSILPDALRGQAFRIDDVARQLNMSARTLQRKLKESGQGYQSLLDEVRKCLSELYLVEGKLSMNEIAFLVGYQEQSSFNHAFKIWNGVSPTVYRGKNRLF